MSHTLVCPPEHGRPQASKARIKPMLLAPGLVLLTSGAWLAWRFHLASPDTPFVRDTLITSLALMLFVLLLLATLTLAFPRSRRPLAALLLAGLAGFTLWMQLREARNDGQWMRAATVLPYATLEGGRVTVHHIHNFDYRTEGDYTPAYYDQHYELSQLERVDWGLSYWGDPDAAHVFLSFVFSDGRALSLSLAPRLQQGQHFAPLGGLLNQYPAYAMVADERDHIRLRTSFRLQPQEQVYLYRAKLSPQQRQRLFLAFLAEINALRTKPAFYNILTNNCTSKLWDLNASIDPQHYPWNWRVFLSGHLPEYLYEHGLIETDGLTFAQLKHRAHINTRSLAAHFDSDYSQKIRETWPLAYYRKHAKRVVE